MSFFPLHAFFWLFLSPPTQDFLSQLWNSVYVHVSIKDFDGVTVQNVKMGKGNFCAFSAPFFDTLDTYFGLWFCGVFLGVFVLFFLLGWWGSWGSFVCLFWRGFFCYLGFSVGFFCIVFWGGLFSVLSCWCCDCL